MAKSEKKATKTVEKTPEPTKETKSAKTSTKAEKTTKAKAEPTPVKEVEAAPTTTTEETPEVGSALRQSFIKISAEIMQVQSTLNSLKAEFRNVEKQWNKEVKVLQRLNSKKKKRATNRSPSGFVKPTPISNELAAFLNKDKGIEMARTEVTREINAYIRAHSLQDKTNGRRILADAKLQTLLKLNKDDELTYFNLQKYMSPHFQKKDGILITGNTISA